MGAPPTSDVFGDDFELTRDMLSMSQVILPDAGESLSGYTIGIKAKAISPLKNGESRRAQSIVLASLVIGALVIKGRDNVGVNYAAFYSHHEDFKLWRNKKSKAKINKRIKRKESGMHKRVMKLCRRWLAMWDPSKEIIAKKPEEIISWRLDWVYSLRDKV